MQDSNTTPELTARSVTDKIAKRGLHAVKKNTARLERLVVEYVDINSVRPNTYNPNRQDKETLELLCKSIEEDGFTQPIIAHKETNEIVDGEHRWRAAREMKMTQIPVVFVSMTDEQMRIATLRHNRARGSEDHALSVDVLRDLQQLGAIEWAQDSLGYSDTELNNLLAEESAAVANAGVEFTEAWAPEKGSSATMDVVNSGEEASVALVEIAADEFTPVRATAMSKAAVESYRKRDEAIAAATTEQERNDLQQTMERPFRLKMVFTGEEADIVKQVLGTRPAEKVLEICQELDPGTE